MYQKKEKYGECWQNDATNVDITHSSNSNQAFTKTVNNSVATSIMKYSQLNSIKQPNQLPVDDQFRNYFIIYISRSNKYRLHFSKESW